LKKLLLFALGLCLAFSALFPSAILSSAFAEQAAPTAEPIPEPTLNPNAEKYDEEHPEELSPDQLYALSAILMVEDTGEVIFEKNPDEIRYPASTTKMLTVLLGILMVDDVYAYVTVTDTALDVPADSSTMKLKAGEEIRFIDVLYGTMLLSGNDGANVIAETVSGSIPEFVNLMNSTAQMYGCTNTHFANPHGYHDDSHYSTARDLAIIARQAMQNEQFREIASAVSWSIPKRTCRRRAPSRQRMNICLPDPKKARTSIIIPMPSESRPVPIPVPATALPAVRKKTVSA